jgi:hypothetical protein
VWDAGATTIPASGNLASLAATGTSTGQITLANAICSSGCFLNVTGNITAGYKPAAEGFILISGSSNYAVTITAANIIGGGNTNAICVKVTNTSGTLAINGHVKGGSSTNTYGLYDTGNMGGITVSSGAEGGSGIVSYGIDMGGVSTNLTVTGNITGGTGMLSAGIHCNTSGSCTLVSSNLINGTGSVAYDGKPPVWDPPNTGYITWAKTTGGATNFYWDVPDASNVLPADTVAGVTGTAASGGGGGAWGF